MQSPNDRYQHDPMFRHLVDTLESLIADAGFTPSELREAVILAAIRYEYRNPIPRIPVEVESWLHGKKRRP